MSKRSEVEQEEICAICFDKIKETNIKATLDCCSHTYCFTCVSKWVQEVESCCPLCRSRIAQLYRVQADGSITGFLVEYRCQEDIVAVCYACRGDINIADVMLEPNLTSVGPASLNSRLSIECEVCADNYIHVSCMHA